MSSTAAERRPAGAGLLVAGIALLGLNLRPAVVAVAPLTSRIRADTGMGAASVSLLTTLPLLCFGLFSVTAPRLGRRLGLERALGLGMVALVGGFALRLIPGPAPLFGGSALAGAGIATLNVLLSGLVKRDFPDHTGLMMGLYSVTLSIGAALAAGLTVPLGHALHAGWRPTLALWGILAVAGLIAWLPVAVHGHAAPAPAPAARGQAPPVADAGPVGVWTSPLAWWVAAYMASQALVFYSLNAWLPTLLENHGVSGSTAGAMLAVFNVTGIATSLTMPTLATRLRTQRAPVGIVAGGFTLGILGLLVAPVGGAWAWMVLLGIAQGAGISLGLTLFVLRTRSAPAAAELSGMAQTVGYLVAALGPLTVGALHGATGGWTPALCELLGVTAVILIAGWSAAGDRVVG